MTAAPKPIMQILKERTAEEHVRIEKSLNLLEAVRSKPDYISLLQRHLGYYRRIEEGLDHPAWKNLKIDFDQRKKIPLLLKDLVDLGAKELEPSTHPLPPLNTFPQVVGAAYVLEGSTLGGQYISRHFSKLLGLTSSQGLAFFNGYGDQTGVKWKEFSSAVNGHHFSAEEREEIVHSALQTFQSVQMHLKAGVA